MSISAISNSSLLYPPTQQDSAAPPAFGQLARSITSGDLSGAQQAFATLTQSQSTSTSPIDPNSQLGQTLSQIGQALQSGNIDSAQQALTAGRGQARGGHHHGGRQAQPSTDTTTATSTTGTTAASSTTDGGVNITV